MSEYQIKHDRTHQLLSEFAKYQDDDKNKPLYFVFEPTKLARLIDDLIDSMEKERQA